MILLGTFVNMLAVFAGSVFGLVFHAKFTERFQKIVFQGLGLCTFALGIMMAMKHENFIPIIFSMIIGGIIGEFFEIEKKLEGLSEKLKKLIRVEESLFTEGLVSAFLIFCIGSLTIMGALDSGIRGDHTLLYTKSMLDGFCSIALAATFGIGVIFSILPMLIYQGALTVFASQFQWFFSDVMVMQITGTGGLLILAIGINLLGIKKIPVSNFLPSLAVIIFLTMLLEHLQF